jgi:hypothetical protein
MTYMTRRTDRSELTKSIIGVAVLISMLHGIGAAQQSSAEEWKKVEAAMGRPGQISGGVIRFGMPRKDLHVTVQGVSIKPGFALGAWAAFSSPGENAILMGDLVLTVEEVDGVMQKLQAGAIEITALHNHLIGEEPRVMYMHIAGHGDAVKMARTIHDAMATTGLPAPDAGAPSPAAELTDLDQKRIEQALSRTGKVNGGILQVGVPRAEDIKDNQMSVPAAMGVGTAINFQPTGSGKAAITGDFVLIATEVNPVMKVLRENGIHVTALHNHMLMEEPRLFFMHFWANDDGVKLANGLRAALDVTNSKKP